MKRSFRAAAWGLGVSILATAIGCNTTQPDLLPSTASLVDDLKPVEGPARLARMQRGDPLPPVKPASLPSLAEQTASARAYVNGRAIFDYEILNVLPDRLRSMKGVRPVDFEAQAKIYAEVLEDLIDQEVVYQEAIRRLEKGNPTALAKLKAAAEQEIEKRIQVVLAKSERKITPEQLREQLPQLRRSMERALISSEYIRSKVWPFLDSVIGFREVRDYYDAHKNEFTTVDTVEWQDVFLAVGPKYPTLADARQAAEQMLARCRAEDFSKLIEYDDGTAKLTGGKGTGSRRGEIRPAELEEYLFKMRDGEVGPVVEISTGVHMFRVVRRDVGGVQPLNDKIQQQIRDKLRRDLYNREEKRIIRELRGRAVIEIEG